MSIFDIMGEHADLRTQGQSEKKRALKSAESAAGSAEKSRDLNWRQNRGNNMLK